MQDAWLAALQAQGEIRGLADWLAGTLRHLARNRARVDHRRERRERRAARAEALPGVDEVSARIEILQRLIAAVDRLEPPYREAIALRYFDDLPPRVIAQRLGIPVNTARTHVRRGIERLRADLDPGPGRERDAFLTALVPLLGADLGSAEGTAPDRPTFPGKRLAMHHPIVLATSVLLLGTLTWILVPHPEPDPLPGTSSVALTSESSGAASAVAPRASAPPSPGHAPVPSGRSPSSAWTVRGRVQYRDAPYPSARLLGRVFAGGRPVGTPLFEEHFQASAEGEFAWAPPTHPGLFNLEVRAERREDLGRPVRGWFVTGDPPPEDWVLAAYPSDATLRGTVRGADGAPLADTWVALALGDEEHGVRSAADGSFALGCLSRRAPPIVTAWREGLAPGYAELVPPLPGSQHVYEIALEPELRLHGMVRGADGAPLAGAQISVDFQGMPASSTVEQEGDLEIQTSSGPMLVGPWPRTLTDDAGRYELAGIHPRATTVVLRASAPDHLPGRVACQSPATTAERDWDLSLALGVTITGRVHAAGEACEGAWITVGKRLGKAGPAETWSDAEGRFTFPGVPAGTQPLRVWRRGFAELRADVDVRAGMDALALELGPSHFLAGLVLGPDGTPLRGAFVWAEDEDRAGISEVPGFGSVTGPDGRFRLADLPEDRIAFSVLAEGCETLSQEVAVDRDDLVLRLVAEPQASAPASETPVVPVTAASGTASLVGRLLDLGGNAHAGEEIELVASAATLAEGPWRATTGAHGEFRFEGLPAGTFDAHWVRREGEFTAIDLEQRVTVGTGEARELELRPQGEATLRGTIEFLTQPPQGSITTGYGRPPVFGPPPSGMPAVAVISLRRFVNGLPSPTGRRGGFAHDGHFELEGLGAGEWYVEAELVIPDPDAPTAPGPGAEVHRKGGGGRFSTGSEVRLPERGAAEVRLGVLYAQ